MLKSYLIILGAVFFLISCKKDYIPLPDAPKGPQTFGWAKAKRNGQDWEGSGGWGYVHDIKSYWQFSLGYLLFDHILLR